MRSFVVAAVLGLTACGTQQVGPEASMDASATPDVVACSGDITSCCRSYCNNDVGGMPAPICVNGVLACPSGYVSNVECKQQHPCDSFCMGASPQLHCVSCDDGGVFSASCDVDAAVYVCPSGSYSEYAPDGSSLCAGDAAAD